MEEEDLRLTELTSLEAIFPEIQRTNAGDKFVFTIDIPIRPANPVTIAFPATSTSRTARTTPDASEGDGAPQANVIESHEFHYLPCLHVLVRLPERYPAESPPSATITTQPPWLPDHVITRLESDLPRLWEEMGRDLVAFTYIDYLGQEGEKVFDLVQQTSDLELDAEHKILLLDYDLKARREAFNRMSFECGVCLGGFVALYCIFKSVGVLLI